MIRAFLYHEDTELPLPCVLEELPQWFEEIVLVTSPDDATHALVITDYGHTIPFDRLEGFEIPIIAVVGPRCAWEIRQIEPIDKGG